MVFALGLKRLGAMWSASKEMALASQQRGSLLGFGFFGSHRAKTSLTNLFSGFRCSKVLAIGRHFFCVPVKQMLLLRQAFQVVCTIVRFVSIDVMNLFARIKVVQPTSRHNAMHQSLTTKCKIPHVVFGWGVRLELSENFSAARNGVKVVEKSVNDSVYFYAQHAVPLKVAKES